MRYFIYFLVMVAFIDNFAQLPIISPFAQGLGGTPLLIGLAVGVYSFSNIIGNILAGLWIDKDGAKRVLYIGLGVTGLILLIYTFVSTPIQLIIMRFLHGFSAGFLVPAAFTYLANRLDEGNKGKSMAISGAIVGVAAIIGPAFGGIMTATVGITWVFLIIGVVMILTALLTFAILPQIDTKTSRRLDDNNSWKSIVGLLKRIPLFYAYLGSFALMFSQGILAYMLPLKVKLLNGGTEVSGMLMSTFALTAILIFILPTNRLFDRFPHENTLNLGLGILGTSLFFLSLSANIGYMYGVMVLYGIGFALIFPSMNALIAQHTNELERGKAFGLFYAFFSIGVVFGSIFTGALAVTPDQAFIIGTVLVLVSCMILLFLIWRQKKVRLR